MYKIIGKDTPFQSVFKENEDGSTTSFPFDPANTDYVAYLAWCAEGNEPLPAEAPAAEAPPADAPEQV